VLEVDAEKRRLKLGIKQMVPTSIDEYLAEHSPGDVVSGRIVEVTGDFAVTELGEGIRANCKLMENAKQMEGEGGQSAITAPDLKSLSSMLQARWKSGPAARSSKPQALLAGQVRRFRITKLDPVEKKVEVELV
jgi:small subunit ribosomal protein S1